MLIIQACSAEETPGGWTFDDLLAEPTDAEVAAVRREWQQRRLYPSDVKVVGSHVVEMEYATFDVTVFSYSLGTSRQYGAAFIPRNSTADLLPVVIGARGVRWDYPVRNLTNGPYAARMLGPLQAEVAFLSPVLRGHSFRFGNDQYDATGDRRDSWDGATDDMIAFLGVALANVPGLNAEKILSFGASRGAAVALLHGVRDERVSATIGYATPADFFRLMGRPGEDWGDSLQAAYGDPEFPENSRESQFIEWFLEDRESLPLADIRGRMIASSPLYFVADLPPTRLHHGADDSSVPVRNAIAVRDRFSQLGRENTDYQVYVYQNAGHQLDSSGAFEETRQFVRRLFGGPESRGPVAGNVGTRHQ